MNWEHTPLLILTDALNVDQVSFVMALLTHFKKLVQQVNSVIHRPLLLIKIALRATIVLNLLGENKNARQEHLDLITDFKQSINVQTHRLDTLYLEEVHSLESN